MKQFKGRRQRLKRTTQIYAPLLMGFSFILFMPCANHAEEHYHERRRPPLSAGMTASEVLQAWGVPSAKQELETQRQEKWLYRGAEVTFKEGQVVKWDGGPAQFAPLATNPPMPEPEEKSEPSQAEALLSEILRDVPAEGDSFIRSTPAAARELAPHPDPMEQHPPGMWRAMPEGIDIERD